MGLSKAQWHKYKASFQAANGTTYKCLEIQVQREGKRPLIARFGGIPLKRQPMALLVDQRPNVARPERNELIKRLLAEKCELCEVRLGSLQKSLTVFFCSKMP
jgi:hypothetical protein